MERLEAHRLFFARLVTAKAGVAAGSELAAAFASTPREHFVGPPPWKVSTTAGYIEHLRTIQRFFIRISSWPWARRDRSITENQRCMPLVYPLWQLSAEKGWST